MPFTCFLCPAFSDTARQWVSGELKMARLARNCVAISLFTPSGDSRWAPSSAFLLWAICHVRAIFPQAHQVSRENSSGDKILLRPLHLHRVPYWPVEETAGLQRRDIDLSPSSPSPFSLTLFLCGPTILSASWFSLSHFSSFLFHFSPSSFKVLFFSVSLFL